MAYDLRSIYRLGSDRFIMQQFSGHAVANINIKYKYLTLMELLSLFPDRPEKWWEMEKSKLNFGGGGG